MKHTVIAPIGDYMDSLFVGIREFPTERIILLTDKDRKEDALKSKAELEKFKIPVQIKELPGNSHVWEEIFEAIADIKKNLGNNPLLINVATGDRDTRCAATSAAFVNGIRAFSVDKDQAVLLPILKFSYYKMLTEKKLSILKVLFESGDGEKKCCASLEELSKKTGMSLPLISYHINGTMKSEGLKELGLIETIEKKGRIQIDLSMMGRLLIKGYIK
ncbi:MAG: DUF6293 family protein [Candidatus Woesearchaeota archaeon]